MVLLPTGVPVSILRIITQRSEAEVELQRICDRTQDEAILHKESTVREVLQSVRRQGDTALIRYTEEFDQTTLTIETLRVGGAELDAAYQQVSKELLDAIRLATSASANNTFICPGIRPATGWMA